MSATHVPSAAVLPGTGGLVVLAEEASGHAVLPNPTPLTRLNYFDGKFLRAQDLTFEQQAHRQLVFLSNTAGGSGVAHGLDVRAATGDALTVTPGLAIDPSGRVLLLPVPVTVPVQALVDAARGTATGAGLSSTAGDGRFGPCAPASAAPTATTLDGAEHWLLTAAHVEGLCGAEEVYARPCDDACATSTDRPYRLEGLVLRLRPLRLTTPLVTSSAVALTRTHLRSRVAAAFFADERLAGGSLLSRAGLSGATWCAGALAPGGTDVPLAVVSRAGAATVFVDAWTVRRERMEAPSRRYWAGRVAMRPWDAFLAQLLQFQCQLRDALADAADDPAAEDPCAEQTGLLADAARWLQRVDESSAAAVPSLSDRADDPLAGLADLRDRVAALLARPRAARRVLIGRGIVELPPAGYLPVDPGSRVGVDEQVRRLLGEGVDVRFCAVRADQVAHELEHAQHLDRISLLAGLDDPARREQVDVLVPDGDITAGRASGPGTGFVLDAALSGRGAVLLVTAGGYQRVAGPQMYAAAMHDPGSLPLRGAARVAPTSSSGGVTFAAAGLGATTSQRVAGRVVRAVHHSVAADAPVDALREELPTFREAETSGTRVRMMATEARAYAATSRSTGADGDVYAVPAERSDAEAVAAWVTARLEQDPWQLGVGDAPVVRLAVEVYSPAKPAVHASITLQGTAEVVEAVDGAAGDRVLAVAFTGGVTASSTHSSDPATERPVQGRVDVVLGTVAGGRTLTVRTPGSPDERQVLFTATWAGSPRHAEGAVGGDAPLLQGVLDQDDDVARPDHPRHELAMSALSLLQGAHPGDAAYLERTAAQLFPPPSTGIGEAQVVARHDWVLFRRRRREDCGAPPPVSTARTAVVWQARAASVEEAAAWTRQLRAGKGEQLPWVRLGRVQFDAGTDVLRTSPTGLRTAYTAAGGGPIVLFAGWAATGTEGAPTGRARARRVVAVLPPVATLAEHGDVDEVGVAPRSLLEAGTEGSVLLVTFAEQEQPAASECLAVARLDAHQHEKAVGDVRQAYREGVAAELAGGAFPEVHVVRHTDGDPDDDDLSRAGSALSDLQHRRVEEVHLWIDPGWAADDPGAEQEAEDVARALLTEAMGHADVDLSIHSIAPPDDGERGCRAWLLLLTHVQID